VAAVRLASALSGKCSTKDVVIDLVGYRRLGHNEADEPSATQPTMYNAIREHPSTRVLYARKLIGDGVLTQADIDKMADDYRAALDEGRNPNRAALGMIGNQYTVDWSRYHQASLNDSVTTGLQNPSFSGWPASSTRCRPRISSTRACSASWKTGGAWRPARSAATGVSRRAWRTPLCSPRTSTCG
jgi:2-oxoglutarate dehydrogenase complex dehydrogenase (E1) component-like enzyme